VGNGRREGKGHKKRIGVFYFPWTGKRALKRKKTVETLKGTLIELAPDPSLLEGKI